MPVTGLRNNNYLNVKNTKNNPWNDADGKPSGTDGRGHAVFQSPAYGVRAGILQLRAYFLDHSPRRQTISDIVFEWAPPDDTQGSIAGNAPNDPSGYAAFVARRMGVGARDRLELFNSDRTINNVGQLRSLFYAMAANEIGGSFKVPDQDFDAGLELVEPGITTHGTGLIAGPQASAQAPAAAVEAKEALEVEAPAGMPRKIDGSVGAVEKGAVNNQKDVLTVQSMLRNAATILNNPRLDPGTINGLIDPESAKSPVVQAIKAFQSRFFTNPDGLIDVGGRSWRELVAVVDNLPSDSTTSGTKAQAAGAAPPKNGKIPVTGFCLYLQRIREEQRAGFTFPRTVSDYQCYWNGEPIHDLGGQMVERNGPGDNGSTGKARHLRIEAGRYPLAIQDGHYKTYGYAAAGPPLPALALENTDERTGILLHPCHHDHGYLSSIGCLNPGVDLKNADSRINLADSRSRVIAIIDALKLKLGNAFPKSGEIPGATVVIEGEPS